MEVAVWVGPASVHHSPRSLCEEPRVTGGRGDTTGLSPQVALGLGRGLRGRPGQPLAPHLSSGAREPLCRECGHACLVELTTASVPVTSAAVCERPPSCAGSCCLALSLTTQPFLGWRGALPESHCGDRWTPLHAHCPFQMTPVSEISETCASQAGYVNDPWPRVQLHCHPWGQSRVT